MSPRRWPVYDAARAMRGATICLLVIGLVVASPARAATVCDEEPMEVFPSTKTKLPTNGRIVLTTRTLSAEYLAAPRWPLMQLRAGTERVVLKQTETFFDAAGSVELVLVPVTPLRPLTRYELYSADPTDTAYDRAQRSEFAWTTAAEPDREAPRWQAPPKAGTGTGAGEISVPISRGEVVQILAEVAAASGTEKPARYLLAPNKKGRIDIGPDACGGPFAPRPGDRYTVRLTAFDVAGNQAAAPGPPVEIVGPPPRSPRRPPRP